MKTKTVNWSSYRIVFSAVILVALLVSAAPASAQAIIKVSDTVNMKFGVLLQGWADWQQLTDGTTTSATYGQTIGYQQNLFIRRMRLLIGGQVAKDVTFFLDTDNVNLGKAPRTAAVQGSATATPPTTTTLASPSAPGQGFQLLDAFVEWKIANEFMIDGGLILVPLCRNCTESAASQLTLDYGSFSFLEIGSVQSTIGRDTGFQAKGYFLNDRLEYRAGAYQGVRLTNSKNAFRFTGRLMYSFLDVEKGPFYAGTYLGKKKVFTVGASYDTQSDYKAWAADAFLDLPVGKGNGVTAEFDYVHYDGGVTFPTFFKQNTVLGQVGFYFGDPKLMPFFRYENQAFTDDARKSGNSRNIQAGLTWYPYGHNFNIRAAYTSRQKPVAVTNLPKIATTNEFTIQVQLFYF